MIYAVARVVLISFSGKREFSPFIRHGVNDYRRAENESFITYYPEDYVAPDAESAYVLLALGVQNNLMNCPAAIESLVRFGGWNGPVYLLTDRETCLNRKEIVANAGMKDENLHIQKVEGDYGSGGVALNFGVGFRKKRLEALSVKTRLFDYIPDQSIKQIAYFDCDILFGVKNCANDFLHRGPSWDDVSIKFTGIYKEDNGDLRDIHCGSFVAHREHSKALMATWRKEILTDSTEGDNDAFMKVYKRYEKQIRAQNKSSELSAVTNAEIGADVAGTVTQQLPLTRNPFTPGLLIGDNNSRIERFVNLNVKRDKYCMNHISKARCNANGRNEMQEFVDEFGLRTYKKDEMYCVHPALTPLLYGWFPISYVPFCPKFETLL